MSRIDYMAIICGPQNKTISYVNQNICGHLVKIHNIEPIVDTITILLDNEYIIPGVGYISSIIGNERVNISLISKNVGSGTANIVFSTESVDGGGVVDESTHYLDIYLKPYSWYSSGGAVDEIARKLGDINGAILNLFNRVGITDYQYLNTEVLIGDPGAPSGNVTIRIKLRQLNVAGMAVLAVPLIAYIAGIVATLAAFVILIGIITGWKFTLSGFLEQISGKKYSGDEVHGIVNTVKNNQLDECNKNYPDIEARVGCQKAVICGAANGLSDALDIKDADCASLGINEKVDTCFSAYQADGDKEKYEACVRTVSKNATEESKKKAPKDGTDWAGLALLLGGAYVVGSVIKSK